MRVRATVTFTSEYEINEAFYPDCKTPKDFVELDKKLLEDDYDAFIESDDTKMEVRVEEVQ